MKFKIGDIVQSKMSGTFYKIIILKPKVYGIVQKTNNYLGLTFEKGERIALD